MSFRSRSVVLTIEAQEDYADILNYTRREWGDVQRDRYDAMLAGALTTLAGNPQIGRSRDDLSPGCRTYLVERHIIYYALQGATILILRILHGRADARSALADL